MYDHDNAKVREDQFSPPMYFNDQVLITKNINGIISDSVIKQQLDLIERELVDAHASLATLKRDAPFPEGAVDFAEEYIQSPSAAWKDAKPKT